MPVNDSQMKPILDLTFDRDSLYALRAAVSAHAARAAMPSATVDDVVAAVHELATNAIRHGAGHGRLRMWSQDHSLHCQVADDGSPLGTARRPSPWPVKPPHGLWLAHRLANRLDLRSGSYGTIATISFTVARPQLRLTQHTTSGCIVLAAAGQLDADSATALSDAVDLILTMITAPRLVVDLAGVDTCDSAGIASLLAAQRAVDAASDAVMVVAGLGWHPGINGQLAQAASADQAVRSLIPLT